MSSKENEERKRLKKLEIKKVDMIGLKFNRLTIESYHSTYISSYRKKPSGYLAPKYVNKWNCKCDCGKSTIVSEVSLKKLEIVSCGCYRAEKQIKNIDPIDRLLSEYTYTAIKKNNEFTLTKNEFKTLIDGDCHYCGAPPSRLIKIKNTEDEKLGEYYYNGIDRVNNDKGYTTTNTVSCCSDCNYAKRNMPYKTFLKFIERLKTHTITLHEHS